MKFSAGMLFLVFCICASPHSFAQEVRHGQVRSTADNADQAWNSELMDWLPIEAFWMHYTDSKGGLTWPLSASYPRYSEVEEFDTFLVQLPQGNCLMEFFHGRWRRANDVRRWDEAFNKFGGCAFVFD